MWLRSPGRHLDEEQPLFGEDDTLRTEQVQKGWDLFEDPPRKLETGSMADNSFFDVGEKVTKIVAYILTFIIVLMAAVVSKGTLLFMTSQVLNDTRPYCNKDIGNNKQLIVTIPQTERVAWVWLLFYAYCIPQMGTFIRSLRICVFKTWTMPKKMVFLVVFITETLPSIGSAMLVFCILPELDVIKGAMLTNAVCFIPGIVGFITRNPSCERSGLKIILDVVSIVAQASSFVVWPLVMDKPVLWLIPVSVILISFGWWENYVSEDSPIKIMEDYAKSRKDFESQDRYFVYIFASLWKCLVFFCTMLLIFHLREGNIEFLFKLYGKAFNEHYIFIKQIAPTVHTENGPSFAEMVTTGPDARFLTNYMTPVWVFLINIFTTYICYIFSKFACRIMIQGFSFAFPINLTMPVVLSGLIAMSSEFVRNECAFADSIPYYLFFDTPNLYYLKRFIGQEQSWIWLVWLLSQTWITAHIWSPTCGKLERTEKLYMRPMYHPFLIDQDVALNRRRDDIKKNEEIVTDDTDETLTDNTTRIFACGTMWHETKEEMMEFLKSIMRLDFDQSAREIVVKKMQIPVEDYYKLETHVFFDDAFIRKDDTDTNPQINNFVKELVVAVNEAATQVHEINVEIKAPKKYVTPYGGRLVWTLPGKTKLITHLKDKKKIRAKKRWSQVMYMYYLLGHKLMDIDLSTHDSDHIKPEDRKEVIAENTYILALDGDIDFQPKAVNLLVDLMKKNKALGAACGRIHPMGSGPMAWYQMFEYAVGHWLQKATEHMIGCVLCSPGCFSLFRGKALMDHNVMKKYTTESSEAMHYVQYDQGEDRWLCTLLLQRGYRVEYSAASDAYTHCPEGFNEFYNQRRRWMPSTTANILDLLTDYKHTISVNDNISRLYIMYQVVLMVGTILGPGTIFLMLVGAFVAAFQMGQWASFSWNIVPVIVFMFVCKVFKEKVQLFFAGLISAIYGLVMMAVLVGVMLQINNDGVLAPSSLFFFCVAGEMIVTALLHPKEINCLIYGLVYYVTVPSMYMLLVIYSVFNMNNVSWGTREVVAPPPSDDTDKPTTPETKEDTLKDKVMNFFSKSKDESGSFDFSIAGLFRCMLCTHEVNSVEKYQLEQIKISMDMIMKKLDNISKGVHEEQPMSQQRRRTIVIEGARASEKELDDDTESEISESFSLDIPVNSWMEDEVLQKGETDFISNEEEDFWKGLLDKYLHPAEQTDDKKAYIIRNLDDLRDKAVAAFFMLNALFVLVVFLLTLKKDLLHINWPFDVKSNFTYHDDTQQVTMVKSYLQLEPIGFVFLFFFAILLVVQFIAMLFHRFGTVCHILAHTTIEFSLFKNADDISPEEMLKKNAVEIAKEMQKLKNLDDDDAKEDKVGRRKTVAAIAKSARNNKKSVAFLDEAFTRRLTQFEKQPKKIKNASTRDTLVAAVQRRTTIVENRRSIVPNMHTGSYDNHGFE